MAEQLTLSRVMAKIEKRLNPVLNENHRDKPNVKFKRSTAVITREEFECLSREIEELVYFQETTLLQEEFLETVYGGNE